MELKGNDYLYAGLGVGAVWLILNNTKPVSQTIEATASVVNPLLTAAGKGAAIVTNPASWKYDSYTMSLLKAPFTPEQSIRAFKMFPSIPTAINAVATNLGLWR